MSSSSITVTVTTAVPLAKEHETAILAAVKKKYAASSVEIEKVVDESVVGGIRLTVGSLQFDTTIASKLATLKYQLKEQL